MFSRRWSSTFQSLNNILKLKNSEAVTTVKGWIQNIRRMKDIIFLEVGDGSTSQKFQIILPNSSNNKQVSVGSSFTANGCIQIGTNGKCELHTENVHVIADGHIKDGYPFTPKQKHPPEYVREFLHLRTRVDYVASLFRLRHRTLKTIHDYMDAHDFVHINTPVLTTNDCEGAGEVFVVKPDSSALLKDMRREGICEEQSYFDDKVYLSVSGQLHLEAMTYGLGNTYTISPAFRAENSKSPLHLAEFYMLEVELAFTDELPLLTCFIETMIKDITRTIINSAEDDLQTCQRKAVGSTFSLAWLDSEWITLSYKEAVSIIEKNKDKLKTPVKTNGGLSKEQELFLVKYCDKPVFVIDWPLEQKPFYMQISRQNANLVHALDLLMPTIGELCGGSLREWDSDVLCKHPDYPQKLNWYLELRKFGGIPTGGFGMGLERYMQLLTGVKNIRDVIPFPRYAHSCNM